jgi:hypothetical protein
LGLVSGWKMENQRAMRGWCSSHQHSSCWHIITFKLSAKNYRWYIFCTQGALQFVLVYARARLHNIPVTIVQW